MYITRIKLKNIRAFSNVELDFAVRNQVSKRSARAPRMRSIIVGKNGTCKSTLLRAIAIGLSDEKDASGLLPEPIGQLVTEGAKGAVIEVHLLSGRGKSIRKIRIRTMLRSERGQDVLDKQQVYINGRKAKRPSKELGLVCAYGAGRSTELAESFYRPYRILDSVYTLFNYEQPLISTELILRRLTDYLGTKKFEKTEKGLKWVLGLSPQSELRLAKGGGVIVSGPEIGKNIPLQGWADGYRITLGWLLDLYAWGMQADCITASGGIRGILLLDELEQHIHPSQQINLLDKLSTFLPDLQIVATTHSPLVALGASPEELVVLRRSGQRVSNEPSVPDFSGYSAEDMLVDPAIFASDVYNPETNRKLQRYRELVSMPKGRRRPEQKKELDSLTAELLAQQIPTISESPIEKRLSQLLHKYNL